MGDRDALILICWIGILLLVFFECFFRKIKARVNRDILPPSSPSGNCRREQGSRFTAPISITCSKEVHIRIEMDEEPPPSYEEALSYASLITKFQFSPYGDANIRDSTTRRVTTSQEDEEDDDDVDGMNLDSNNNPNRAQRGKREKPTENSQKAETPPPPFPHE